MEIRHQIFRARNDFCTKGNICLVIFLYIFEKKSIFKIIKKVRIIRIKSGVRLADQKYSYFAPEGRENFGGILGVNG